MYYLAHITITILTTIEAYLGQLRDFFDAIYLSHNP